MAAVYFCMRLEPERQIRPVAGYDFFCSGWILYAHHCRHFHTTEKKARCGEALQGIWLPSIAHHLYYNGIEFLYTAHHLQTGIYLARVDYNIIGNTDLCDDKQKKAVGIIEQSLYRNRTA